MSGFDPELEPRRPFGHVEIVNGADGRRRWSTDDKARIVEETLVPGAIVSEVARRHGLTPQQVFTWRRLARRPVEPVPHRASPLFVPALAAPAVTDPVIPVPKPAVGKDQPEPGIIELEIDGVPVRIGRGAEAKTIVAVIRALKPRA